MADDPDQDDGAANDLQFGVAPGVFDNEDGTRLLRGRRSFRGHIVVGDDERLPVFAVPAEPPPPPADDDKP